MKKKFFKRSIVHYLRFDEYHSLVDNIFIYLRGVVIENSNVSEMIENAKRHIDALLQIVERRRFHDSSTAISDLADSRHKMLRSFNDTAKAGENTETQEKRDASRVIGSFLRKEKRAFSRRRINLQTTLVSRLINEVSINPEFYEAMETLSIDGLYEAIVEKTRELSKLRLKRIDDRNRLKDLAEERRHDSYEDLMIMLTTLENQANVEGPDKSFYREVCSNIQSLFVEAKVASEQRKSAPKDENGNGDAPKEDENGNQNDGNSEGDRENQSGIESKES